MTKTRRILVTSAIGMAQRGSATLGTLLIFPYVLHTIGLTAFGLWGAAASLAMIINFADFGLGPMIIAGISREMAAGNPVGARRIFGASVTAAVVIAVGLAMLTPLVFAVAGQGTTAQVFAIVVLGVAANVPLGIANPMWIGLQKGWMMAFWEFAQSLIFVGGLYVCGLYTNDVRLFSGAIYLAIVVSNAFNMLSLIMAQPQMRPPALPAPWVDIRPIIAPSAKYFALTMLDAMTYLIDATLALQVVGAAAAAQMTVIQRMAAAVTGVLMILSQYLWPHYVEAWMKGDRRWMTRALWSSIAGVTVLSLGVLVVLGLLGPWLGRLWLHRDIGFQGVTFAWLAAWILVVGVARSLATVLSAMDVLGVQITLFSVFIALSLVAKVILPRYFGVDGILLGVIIPGAVVLIPGLAIAVAKQINRKQA